MADENKELEDLRKRAETAESELEQLKNDMAEKSDNPVEIAELKRQLAEAKSQISDFESKTNSDVEKAKADELQKLKDDLETANKIIRENETEKAFADKANELKVKNPQKLLALVKDKIEFDESGKPKNLKEVLEQAKKDYAEEFGEPTKSESKKKESVDGGAKDDSDSKFSDDMTPTERMRAAYADLERDEG